MASSDTLPAAYDPHTYEHDLYARWEASGLFNPDVCVARGVTRADAAPFSIVLPPPNVTGVLHTGHAAMLAIEDTIVRYHRMRGDRTLWLPGTDHAAIATQSKVEKIIRKEEGKTRHDLGREAFLARVQQFAQDSHDTIVGQCRAMGSSLDWSREAFTLDDARSRAVAEAFRRMYDDGLIERGDRIVNWDPVGQTTISDDEVVYEERQATLYTFRYAADFPVPIATTRPETKLGDTAVAVHPDDTRYAQYVGQTFTIDDFCGTPLTIRVIADRDVDPAFGTGALGVTPAHSHIDWELAERHDLPRVTVIDEAAHMTVGAVAGQDVTDARAAVVAWLREHNLLENAETITQNVATAERTGAVIEPLPKKQWFVAVNKPFLRDGRETTLKTLMHEAVASGATTILPNRFAKVYDHWIDNLRPWCISRQIWYGHRIPVWYRGDEIAVGTAPDGDGWEQDPDTLDTWFSSGLWTFSTLGWPDTDAADLRTYHPTALLETGYDILFFWVARMILMSTYLLGEVPFRTVYLHGLVRDEQGRKMSKSLGNTIDPLDVTARYGTDAVRLALLIGATPGNDMRLGEDKIATFRNFTNKLWNIGRYVLTQSTTDGTDATPAARTAADRWILARLNTVTATATDHLDHYRLSQAGETLRDFTWGDVADWYVEAHKMERNDAVLRHVFDRLLRLWHPFMPFVTETLWGYLHPATTADDTRMLMVAAWPTANDTDGTDAQTFAIVRDLVTKVRAVRAAYRLESARQPRLACDTALYAAVQLDTALILRLARVAALVPHEGPAPDASATVATAAGTAYVLLEDVIDVATERQRMETELAAITTNIAAKESRLANPAFTERAPAAIVAKERELAADMTAQADALRDALSALH